jgi:hypothetical protein
MRPTSMHLANSVQKTVHPTGMAVDLRAPQRAGCRSWMRTALLGLERQGVVNATEEHRPAHFHVWSTGRPDSGADRRTRSSAQAGARGRGDASRGRACVRPPARGDQRPHVAALEVVDPAAVRRRDRPNHDAARAGVRGARLRGGARRAPPRPRRASATRHAECR